MQKYACIYNHWDGYPQALGIKLASIVLAQWGKAWDQGGVEYSTNHMLAAFMRHPDMKEGVSLLPVEDECFRTKYVTWTYVVMVDEDKWQVFLSATNGRLRVEELEPLKFISWCTSTLNETRKYLHSAESCSSPDLLSM